MERIIIYSPEVKRYLKQLVHTLFKNDYFGFRKDAKNYVGRITEFIEQKIETYPTKNTPPELIQHGEKYIRYKANEHTTWYIFFSQTKQTYFVKFITNSHSSLVAKLNIDE